MQRTTRYEADELGLTADPADQLVHARPVEAAHDLPLVDDEQGRHLPVEVFPLPPGRRVAVNRPHPALDAQAAQMLAHDLRLLAAVAGIDDCVHVWMLTGSIQFELLIETNDGYIDVGPGRRRGYDRSLEGDRRPVRRQAGRPRPPLRGGRRLMALSQSVVGELQRIVGRPHVVHEPNDLRIFERDGSITGALPDAVVLPADRDQVVRVGRLAARPGIPVVPRGAGTGLSGGAITLEGGITLQPSRTRRILETRP